MSKVVRAESIECKIFQIRGKKVLLDSDLAMLYGVKTFNLNKAVKRNMRRFPADFMFKLTEKEYKYLRFQIGISKSGSGGRRYMPYAFTEQGVAMLSSVLNSERAISVNIQIMRAFVNMKRIGLTYSGLKRKIEDMEEKYDGQFAIVFDAIKRLLEPPPEKSKPRIGFHP
jgi:hypothetical protein